LKGSILSHIFAVNKTSTHLSLKTGYLVIPASGYVKIHKDDMAHPDFRDAVTREWVHFTEDEPEAVTVALGPKIIESALDALGGMTEAELKASQSQSEEKKEAVVVTKLGEKEAQAEAPAPEAADVPTEQSESTPSNETPEGAESPESAEAAPEAKATRTRKSAK
jgi:outer membrane biosynthesis protein TonB